MNPVGQNIATYVKALYKVGDLKTLRKFIVSKDLKSPSEIELNKILNDCLWGYDFKMKNCTWTSKREFYLTMETNKMSTIGVENYYGIILRDTARLIINNENRSNPFARIP
jgi:hypothetical protein